jgi:hypothetical protein
MLLVEKGNAGREFWGQREKNVPMRAQYTVHVTRGQKLVQGEDMSVLRAEGEQVSEGAGREG